MADNLKGIPFTSEDEGKDFLDRARMLVGLTYNQTLAEKYISSVPPDEEFLYKDQIYVVWFCYIRGGWKCLLSTSKPDGKYYEVTYDKERSQTYVDVYLKVENHEIPD